MTEVWKSASESAVVLWPVFAFKKYIYTMTEIMANTFDELKPAPGAVANLRLGNKDLTVLMTACFSVCGLVMSLFVLFCVLKFVCWICFGSFSSEKGIFDNET
jgi:hypothetical protein